MAVVARAGQALGRDRALLGAGARLQGVEEREADRLLQLGVALELDVGALPEVVEVRALVREQPVPAGVARLGERGDDLVAQRRHRALARPAVGEELDDAQPLARREVGGDRDAAEVGPALRRRRRSRPGALDDVVHAGGHPQLAAPASSARARPRVAVEEALRDERRLERRRRRAGRRDAGGAGSFATSSDCTTTRSALSSGSTS